MTQRFVVRYTDWYDPEPSEWMVERVQQGFDYDIPGLIKDRREAAERRKGQYEKVGGGITTDLQEANVVGWTKKSKERWEGPEYELVPVEICLR